MRKNYFETIVGFIIIIVAFTFLAYAYNLTHKTNNANNGYVLNGRFQNVEGLVSGSDVMIAGINVGHIEEIILDHNDFSAKIVLRINKDIKIPTNSRAAVATAGILGNRYVNIIPGADETDLEPNGYFKYTQSSINIESLINKVIASLGSKSSFDKPVDNKISNIDSKTSIDLNSTKPAAIDTTK